MRPQKGKTIIKALAIFWLLAVSALAAGDWVLFKGQVNGPVAEPSGIDPSSFTLKKYPGLFWTEGYYHHMNFPDGSMITINFGFNRAESNIAFVYAKPGMKPVNDYLITDIDEAMFDASGFGFSIGKNRVQLKGSKYVVELDLPKTKAKIVYDIVGPSCIYGDGMVRYPDGDSYMFYNLPISWAKVKVEAVIDGATLNLSGSGNMNHDAGVIFPGYIPSNWQVFWFFGDDHAVLVTDHYTNRKFGRKLTQRLVFVDREGSMFTSTSFKLKWDDWEKAKDIPFRYPKTYTLLAEGGGAKIEMKVKMKEVLLLEDLFSNLPGYLRLVVERLTRNAWTVDSWSDYTLTYSHDGRSDTYHGRGIARWTDLEEDK